MKRNQESRIELPEWALINATRYAIGRMTYISEETSRLICSLWPKLSEETRSIIERDLEAEYRRYENWKKHTYPDAMSRITPLGHDTDKKSWDRVRALWRPSDEPTSPL